MRDSPTLSWVRPRTSWYVPVRPDTSPFRYHVVVNNAAHHYVPQFYLRRFSPDQSSVGTFIAPDRFVDCASIKGQAQRRHLYGRTPELRNF